SSNRGNRGSARHRAGDGRASYMGARVTRERTVGSTTRQRVIARQPEVVMSISLLVLIVLVLLLIGALPTWGYSSGWGYWPSGGLGLVLLVLIVLMLMGRL